MLFQCPQFPLPLTPFLAVSAANAELANLPYLLLIQDALKILAATVRAGILSSRPAAETAAGARPASEARVAEMLATAGSEAGIPQDLFADDAHVLVGDRESAKSCSYPPESFPAAWNTIQLRSTCS